MMVSIFFILCAGIPKPIQHELTAPDTPFTSGDMLDERSQFNLVDGKINDLRFDANTMKIKSKNGWSYKCDGNPILLQISDRYILVFTEPGFWGYIHWKTYKIVALGRERGNVLKSLNLPGNPRSMIINNNVLYVYMPYSNPSLLEMSLPER